MTEPKYEPEFVRAEFARGRTYSLDYGPQETHLYISNEIKPLFNERRLDLLSRMLFPNSNNQIIDIKKYENSIRISFPPLKEEDKEQDKRSISKLIKKIKEDLAA